VRIGGVRVTNVRALVLAEGLHVSLLGMTYLGELQKVEVMPHQMILRR
jgi:aspartyl protease family protein